MEDRNKFLKQQTSVKNFCTGPSGQYECERLEQRTPKSSGNTLNGEILVRMTASFYFLFITLSKIDSILSDPFIILVIW